MRAFLPPVLLKIQAFSDVVGMFGPEKNRTMTLSDNGNYTPVDTPLHPT
jgi:hypothetical protein